MTRSRCALGWQDQETVGFKVENPEGFEIAELGAYGPLDYRIRVL